MGVAPVGPYLCTPDELSHADLRLWLTLNGELMQEDRTSSMIFDVAALVSYTSEFMTLCPGDLFSTGTPSGVGGGPNAAEVPARGRRRRMWHREAGREPAPGGGIFSVI